MRRRDDIGAYDITSLGVAASSPTLGSAISKAQTIASRIQREGLKEGEVRSLYIRKLGGDTLARIDVRPEVIETYALA